MTRVMPFRSFNILLKKLGNHIGLPTLLPTKDGYCCLKIDDSFVVNIQMTPETDSIFLYSDLAKEASLDLDTLRACMKAHCFGQSTQEARASINYENSELILEKQIPISGLSFQTFITAFDQFLDTVEQWLKDLDTKKALHLHTALKKKKSALEAV